MKIEKESFAKNFKTCCLSSIGPYLFEQQQNSQDYAERLRKCEKLYRLIEEKLETEHDLINEFDAAKNSTLAFNEIIIYQEGFQDCVYLLQWMGLL